MTFQEKLSKWKETIGLQCFVNTKESRFYDTLHIYKHYNRYPEAITPEKIKELDPNITEKDLTKVSKNDMMISVYAFLIFQKKALDYDIVYTNVEKSIKEKFILQGPFDCFADIKVYGATFAHLHCESNPNFFEKFEMVKVGDYFTLTDITYENPLFRSRFGNILSVYTDGNIIKYRGIFLSLELSELIKYINDYYQITHFPSMNRLLFNGNVWAPPHSCKYSEIQKA